MVNVKRMAAIAATAVLISGTAQAAQIFNETLTGLQLSSDSDLTIFENPTLNGTSLDYTGRSTTRGALLIWDILGAGDHGDIEATISIDHDDIGSGGVDNDLFIGFTDGVNVVAPARIDSNGGAVALFDGTVGGTPTAPSFANLAGSGISISGLGSSVDPLTLSFLFPGDGAIASLTGSEEDGITQAGGSIAFTRGLNIDNGLQLILFGDQLSSSERYRINSIGVTVDTTPVPVPAALPLLASALLGFGIVGWRRKQRVA